MPQIQCPACSARMNAPDTAIGKRIKCPKCAKAFFVEEPEADDGFEVIEEAVRTKPKSRAVVVVDDDDDEEMPKKKARKVKKKPTEGKPVGLWIGAGVVALLLIGGGVFFATRGSSGWTKFRAPDNSFTTAFPDGEPVKETRESLNKDKPGLITPTSELFAWSRVSGDRKYFVIVELPPAHPDSDRMTAENFIEATLPRTKPGSYGPFVGKIRSSAKSAVNGTPAIHFVNDNEGKTSVCWAFFANKRLFFIIVDGEASMAADDPKATAFMNKFAKGG